MEDAVEQAIWTVIFKLVMWLMIASVVIGFLKFIAEEPKLALELIALFVGTGAFIYVAYLAGTRW